MLIFDLLTTASRDEVWPWSPDSLAAKGKLDHLHTGQLLWPACIPNGYQLLQDCLIDQLSASLEGDRPEDISSRCLDHHRARVYVTPGMHPVPHLCLRSGKCGHVEHSPWVPTDTPRAQVDKSWNPLKEGRCLPPGPSFTGYAMVTIVSDVVVAAIPIPVLIKLNVQFEKKLGLIGIFALGLFTTLCSIMRYLQINRIQNGDGNSTMLVLWGTIEFNVGVSVAHLCTVFDELTFGAEHCLVFAFSSAGLRSESKRIPL